MKFKKWNSIFIISIMTATALAAAPVYLDNGDGTVTDRATALVWQKCSMGQNNDATCTGTATMDTWANAVAYCNGLVLGGRTWRLANINELLSITDYTVAANPAPAINTTVFPATVAGIYWSSTSNKFTAGNSWAISFLFGGTTSATQATTYYARCVATGP